MNFIVYKSKNEKIFLKKVLQTLKKKHFCIIKNFHSVKHHQKIIDFFKNKFEPNKDVRLTGPRRLSQGDYQRIDIGNSYKNPRFIRTIYVNEQLKKNKIFFKNIEPIVMIRNYVSKIKKFKNFYPTAESISKNLDKKKYIFCDFVRMIQYPLGGGFLAEHHDHDIYYCKGIYQALLPLTVKKLKNKKNNFATYDTGGLYLKIKNKKKIFIDDYIRASDLLLFDPKLLHGINSVDPTKKLNLNNLNGRLTLAFSISNFLK